MIRLYVMRAALHDVSWFALPGHIGSDLTDTYTEVDDMWKVLKAFYGMAEGIDEELDYEEITNRF